MEQRLILLESMRQRAANITARPQTWGLRAVKQQQSDLAERFREECEWQNVVALFQQVRRLQQS